MSSQRPRLAPKRTAALARAAQHPKGSIPASQLGLTARDEEALEQLGYAASIDDCGDVLTSEPRPADDPHRGHPHFFRITAEGRAAVSGDAS
jgi:hypothetical protein